MITIENYKLGEGAHFLGWQLDSVTEGEENYGFLWTDIGSKRQHQYLMVLGRRYEDSLGRLPIMMFDAHATPGSQPIWSGTVNRMTLEYHWEFIEKSINIMKHYRPFV